VVDRPAKAFFLTVDVEEWFASKFIELTAEERAKPTDFEEPMTFLLDLLAEAGVRGTFFWLHHTARKYPAVIRRCIAEGHEIALHGDDHDGIPDLGEEGFRDMLRRMRAAFRSDFGVELQGYRAPNFGISPRGLEILTEEGYRYESSMVPCLPIPGWYGSPGTPVVPHRHEGGALWEFPVSVHPWLRLPGGGGYYFRNLGYHWTRWVLLASLRRKDYAMFYIHPWELSLRNPSLDGVPFYTFRRTGDWTRNRLGRLLRVVSAERDVSCRTVAQHVETLA
jgi:polysaccharide deacetylase family protein (PEP-CTERM system associated)